MTQTTNDTRSVVDELLDRYLSWREESAALDAAFRRWTDATAEDRDVAFAAYRAQLDLEEHAAKHYELSVAAARAEVGSDDLALAA